MANGREAAALRVRLPDAFEPRKRIYGVLLDAHGVLFEPIGCSHIELQKRLLEEVLGRKIDTPARELATRVRTRRLEAAKRFPLSQLGSVEAWGWTNAAEFGEEFGLTEELGRELSRRISKPELYEMKRKTHDWLRWLLERKFPFRSTDGCFIATASNSEAVIVDALLYKSGHRDHFRYIITADRLGNIYKPSGEYFRALIEVVNRGQAQIGSPPITPSELLFIGNSIMNDAPAAEVGINVVILRDSSETLTEAQISEYLGPIKDQILWAQGWKDARRKIDQRFRRPKPQDR